MNQDGGLAMVGETDVALALLRIASEQPEGIATFRRLLVEVPKRLDLSARDVLPARDNPGRCHWEHVLRSIKLHAAEPGNILREGYAESIPRIGYRITDAGRAFLQNPGRI